MRFHNAVRTILVFLLVLAVCVCTSAYAEETLNPAYEFYFQQLDANQQAMYRAILAAPAETATYTLVLPEDGGSYENVFSKLHITMGTIKMDHPETMAWLSWVSDVQYDADSNSMTYTLECDRFYDPDDQALSEKLLDVIAAQADPAWDYYTKAWFISNVVQDALDYDMKYVFYPENGKADYYNSNIFCVNNGYGICGGFSKLYKAIADRIGLPCVEVSSVGHGWVHVQMEDGNWYGQEPQDPVYLQGTSTMVGHSFMGSEDMYILYDGFFDENLSIHQPERVEYDYVYNGTATDPGSVDLTQARLENTAATTTFEYTVNEDGVTCTITGFSGKESGDLVIPESIDGYTVTMIGNSAFTYANFDGTLTLPDTIVEIGNQAFTGCDKLTGQLVLPANLKTIKASAFIGCSGFTGEIGFNDKLEMIGRGAFGFCTGLTGSLMLPDSITTLEKSSFYECMGLNGVLHIPSGISEWSAAYIELCDNLSGFDVSANHPNYCVVDGILYSKDMTQVLQCMITQEGAVVIPEGVTVIGPQAFYRCEKITSISFPSTLKRIEAWGCAGTQGITEKIVLPESLEYLGNGAFQGCSGIKDILVVPAGVQLGESVFETCQQVTCVIVEDGVTNLPANTFFFCTGIDKVYLPQSIESIGNSCFFCVNGVKIYGTPGTAAEAFVNSAEGQELRAEFYPQTMSDGYLLIGETYLSLIDADHSRTTQLSIAPEEPMESVVWSSSDKNIATVVDGLVTGISPGKVTITAAFGSTVLQCTIMVHNGVIISDDGKTLYKVSTNYVGELVIPEGVEVIDSEAVNSVQNLTGIVFPSTLIELRSNAIYGTGYSNPFDLSFPQTTELLEELAVQNCRLRELQYPNNVQVLSMAFSMCTIDQIRIPEGVKSLPQNVFQYASITDCYLPASLTSAPYNAFENATVETFYGYAGTFAEEYVTGLQECYPDKNYQFVALEGVKIGGDANSDGTVDVYDALLILQYGAGWNVTLDVFNADYDCDGTVDIADAVSILKYLSGGDTEAAMQMLRVLTKDLAISLAEIVVQPIDQYVQVGKQGQFVVSVTGEDVKYQWYINRDDGAGWCKLTGATKAKYVTSTVTLDNHGYQYRCVVTDAYGNEVISDTAMLHVVLELPNTGDEAQPLLYALAMLVSGMALLWMFGRKRIRQ